MALVCPGRGICTALLAVVLWLAVATVFYAHVGNCKTVDTYCDGGAVVQEESCGWDWAESFYYAVQAGLSIGFGLLPETKDGSRLFTVYHVLAGSSFIGGVLAFFMSLVLTRQQQVMTSREREMAEFSMSIHTDGYSGFTLVQLQELMMDHPTYCKDLHLKAEPDLQVVLQFHEAYTALQRSRRLPMAHEVISKALSRKVLTHENVKIEELVKIHQQSMSLSRKLLDFARTTSEVRIFAAFFAMVAIGVVFGMVAEEWSFIQSLYFSVAAMSTGGLQAVSNSTGHVIFAGIYCLFGVPLYGMVLGSFATLLIDGYQRRQMARTINQRLEAADVEYVQHILEHETAGNSGEVDIADYIELQLLRLGKVDRDLLMQLRARFKAFDKEGRGKVKIAELAPEADRHLSSSSATSSQANKCQEVEEAAVVVLRPSGCHGTRCSMRGLQPADHHQHSACCRCRCLCCKLCGDRRHS